MGPKVSLFLRFRKGRGRLCTPGFQEREYGGTPTASYTRGPDLSGTLQGAGGIGGLLARSAGYSSGNWSVHHAYHADGGGNITAMVNTSQALSANYRYDSFGNLISSSGTMASANTYRFSSKDWIANADLYYYGYRFYSPNYQRWVNQDPIGENGGINLYRFAGNSPLNRVDPIGEVAPFIALCAAAAADYVAEKALDYVGNNWVPEEHQGTFNAVRDAYDAASSVNPGKAGRKMAAEAAEAAGAAAAKLKKKLGGGKNGGGDKSFDEAREEAFEKAGMTDPKDVEFSKVDPETGTVVEFKGPGGAKVGYDGPHAPQVRAMTART